MKRNILTFLAHFFAGVITILSVFIHPIIPVVLAATFYLYEAMEDKTLHDKSFRDVRQFSYGAFLTAVILIILHFI